MIKIAICDDDIELTSQLETIIKNFARNQNIHIETDIFFNGKSFMEYIEKQHMLYDLVFLDIEMDSVSGMELARHIREREENSRKRRIIIFVTGYREYMGEAFDVNAFHYLLKPLDEKKFTEVFARAWKEASAFCEQEKKYIMVKSLGAQQRLLLKDIYYIESRNKKVIIHTTDKTLEVYGKMEELENRLGSTFYRCHRCYLVNMENISAYSADNIQVINGDNLLLARKKYSDFIKAYLRYAKNGGIVNV